MASITIQVGPVTEVFTFNEPDITVLDNLRELVRATVNDADVDVDQLPAAVVLRRSLGAMVRGAQRRVAGARRRSVRVPGLDGSTAQAGE